MIKEWVDSHRPIRSLACPARFERATYALEEIVSFLIQFINKRSLAEYVSYLEIKGSTGLPMAIKIYSPPSCIFSLSFFYPGTAPPFS
jgi:hypothetical protein